MSNAVSPIDLEFLTQGSVWKTDKGSEHTVLMTVNEAVPKSRQGEYPISVIYADQQGNVFCVPRAKFLAKRKFHNVDPDVEIAVTELFEALPGEEEESEMVVQNNVPLDQHPIMQAAKASVAEQESEGGVAVVPRTEGLVTTFGTAAPQGQVIKPPVIDANLLSSAVAGYAQMPDVKSGRLMHEFSIELKEGLTLEDIYKSFSSSNPEQDYYSVVYIGTHKGVEITVDWDYLVGVYPNFYANTSTRYATLVLATDQEVQPDAEPAEEMPASQRGLTSVSTPMDDAPYQPALPQDEGTNVVMATASVPAAVVAEIEAGGHPQPATPAAAQ
ncbi:hypothetical protein [Burkholderia phage BCSR5]|nr:hypothetical protein [Burkholderia phage BCSR5]